jgi:hypothetical protein
MNTARRMKGASRDRSSLADFQRRQLVGVVAASQFRDRVGIRRTAARRYSRKLFEIMLVTGRRYGHENPRGFVADVADVVGNTRRQEQICAGLGADQLAVDLPLA